MAGCAAAVTDIVGGGPFGLAPGEWTDDTSMALCLADSLLAASGLDPGDLIERFCRWYEHGYNSVTGECFDIGVTTAGALQSFRATGKPLSGSTDPDSAGNGSLMRLAPVAIRWWHESAKAVEAARLQSRTTHGAAQTVEACALYAEVLTEAVARRRSWDRAEHAGAVDVDRRRSWLGAYLAQSEAVAQPVEDALPLPDAEVQGVQVLRSQVPRPPQPRLLHLDPEVQLGRSGRECRRTRLERLTGSRTMGHGPYMTVSKSQFKPHAFEYFRLVQEQRETIVVTDRGTPVLKIVPFEEEDDPDLAALRGTLVKYEEPLEPVGEPWEAAE